MNSKRSSGASFQHRAFNYYLLVLRQYPALLVGFSLFWLWRLLVFDCFVLVPGFSDTQFSFVNLTPLASYALGFLVVGLLYKVRGFSPRAKNYSLAVAVVMATGAFLMAVTHFLPLDNVATKTLFVVGGISLGFGTSLLHLEWGRMLSSLGSKKTLILGTAAIVVASVLLFVLQYVPVAVRLLVVILIPVPCTLPLRRHGMDVSEAGRGEADSKLLIPWKFLATSLLQGVALGAIQSIMLFSPAIQVDSVASIVGASIAGSLLLVLMANGLKMNFNRILYQISFPLMAAGFLVISLFGALPGGHFLHSVGFRIVALIMWVLCAYLVKENKLSAYWVFPLPTFAYFSGQALGSIFGMAFLSVSGDGLASVAKLSTFMVFLLLVGALLMLSERNLQKGWGLVQPGENDILTTIFDQCCNKICVENELTLRETDVFRLLAKGYSRTRICEELFLSKDTIKTHSRNLYRKLSIHSQQEVIKLVEDLAESAETNAGDVKEAFLN